MRASGQTARAAALAVVVLAALALVALAAGSERAATVAPAATAGPADPPPTDPTPGRSGRLERTVPPGEDTSGGGMAQGLFLVVGIVIAVLALSALTVFSVAVRPRTWLPPLGRARGAPPVVGAGPPDRDEAAADRLAAAARAGLRELEQGGPGEGVIACWVLLERAAADAGTHRARPDTPSELAGRLIDRHEVSPGPLLRLAELYREARYSEHVLPESARTEAAGALARVADELAASPLGRSR